MLIYIDTNILLALSKFDKSDKDVLRLMKKTFYGQDIRVPQIVLGEAITQILNKTDDDGKISEYVRNLKNTLSKLNCTSEKFPTANENVIKCAIELGNISGVVSNMDSLILAHPVIDKNATHFYSKDKSLKNDKVREYIRNLKKQGIRTQELNMPENFTG